MLAGLVPIVYYAGRWSRLSLVTTPLLLLMIGGFVGILILLTYNFQQLRRQVRSVFSARPGGANPSIRNLLIQVALYCLVAGLVLAVTQLLIHADPRDPRVPVFEPQAVRTAFLTLLYGITLAMVFWAVAWRQRSPDAGDAGRTGAAGRPAMVVSCTLLVAMAALVSLILLGLTRQNDRPVPSEASGRLAVPAEPQPVSAPRELAGLYQGDDLIWRPKSFYEEEEHAVSSRSHPSAPESPVSMRPIQAGRDAGPDDPTALAATEAPLRWELSVATDEPPADAPDAP